MWRVYTRVDVNLVVSQISRLKKELEELKKKTNLRSVDSALSSLQKLVGRPPPLFDAHSAIAALEELVDLARETDDARYKKYNIILRQCRSLVGHPTLQQILIKLVACNEEAEVAGTISKMIRETSVPYPPPTAPYPATPTSAPYPPARNSGASPRGFRGGKARVGVKCWVCGQFGHFARTCNKKQ